MAGQAETSWAGTEMSTIRDVLTFRAAAAVTGMAATEFDWDAAAVLGPADSLTDLGPASAALTEAGDTAVIVAIGGELQAVQPVSFFARLPAPLDADIYAWGYHIQPGTPVAGALSTSGGDETYSAAEAALTDRLTLTPIVRQYITIDEGSYREVPARDPGSVVDPATGRRMPDNRAREVPPVIRLAESVLAAPAGGLTPNVACQTVLAEVERSAGIVQPVLVNSTMWDGLCERRSFEPAALCSGGFGHDSIESARARTTEIWESCNLMEDAHCLHLVEVRYVRRHGLDASAFKRLHDSLFPGVPYPCATADADVVTARRAATAAEVHVSGIVSPRPADAGYVVSASSQSGNRADAASRQGRFAQDGSEDLGWEDVVSGGDASRHPGPLRVDSAAGPAYVWHCHIVRRQNREIGFPYVTRP
jgi:hypothetical protein